MKSTLLQAVSARRTTNSKLVGDGVIHHSDASGQYVSLALTEKRLDHGAASSIWCVSTTQFNALVENTIAL